MGPSASLPPNTVDSIAVSNDITADATKLLVHSKPSPLRGGCRLLSGGLRVPREGLT